MDGLLIADLQLEAMMVDDGPMAQACRGFIDRHRACSPWIQTTTRMVELSCERHNIFVRYPFTGPVLVAGRLVEGR